MRFNPNAIHPGDLVSMRAKGVPFPEFQAAVHEVTKSQIVVFSTQLAVAKTLGYTGGGTFKGSDVLQLEVYRPASEAIPLETGGKFRKGQHLTTKVEGKTYRGTAYAAFNGIVEIQLDDGTFSCGGTSFFKPARARKTKK